MTSVRSEQPASQGMRLQGAALVDTKTGYSSLEPAVDEILGGVNLPAARKILTALPKDELQKVFASPIGPKRMIPVLDAARRGAPHMLALYAGMGAALNVQTPFGLTPIHVAFDYNELGTARTLLTDPTLRERLIDASRVPHAFVREKLAMLDVMPARGGHGDDDQVDQTVFDKIIDQVTLSITDGNPKQLITTDRLGLYVSHIYEQKDSPTNFEPEGWNPEAALEHRVRTLVGMIAMTEPKGKKRDRLVREIAVCTEALQLERRVYRMTNITDMGLTKLGLEHEALGIIGKLENAVTTGNRELTHQLIPVATPKHLMCLGLQPIYVGPAPGEPSVLVHFDNLGAGNDAHEKEGLKVYPLTIVFPLRRSADGKSANLGLLKDLLVDILSQRGKGDIAGVYQGLYRFMTALTAADVKAVTDPDSEDVLAYSQAAGNCTIANMGPGTRRRLGEYADEFLAFEGEDAIRRQIASCTPEVIRAGVATTVATNKAKRGL